MRIIAIDPGTRRTGYSVFEVSNAKSRLEECGTVFVRGKDLPEKLLAVHRGIERLFRRLKPRQVVIERPFTGKNARDAMTLNAARAVCMLAAAVNRARVFEYAPSQVKKSVTGDGNASKDTVQHYVSATLGLRQAPEPDTADAIALAICHLNRL
jgi:crossover junction endodeoxyribonuclease RuvC